MRFSASTRAVRRGTPPPRTDRHTYTPTAAPSAAVRLKTRSSNKHAQASTRQALHPGAPGVRERRLRAVLPPEGQV